MNQRSSLWRRGCQMMLGALLLAAGIEPTGAVNLVQEFYLPMPEAQIYQANSAIISGTGSTIASTFSIVVTGDGTVIYYDQWEDGYETDLGNPAQASTKIWGDGNDANGIPPGMAHDPLGLPTGTVITLTNSVTLPRNPSTLLWDARDRVAATKALVISRAAWPVSPGPVFAGAVGVLSTLDYGTNYVSPVGSDMTNGLFKYVGMFVMAGQNNTAVTIDPNGNGIGTTNLVLNQGESYLVNGGIKKGGRVTASKPVQADLLIGHVGASYASDWFTLYPVETWSSTYFTPVGTAASGNPAYVYLFNPNTNAIVINYTTQSGAGSFSVPGTNGVFQFQMPVGSGGSFVSAGGQNFFAISTVAANPAADTAYNWGFTLVPQTALTTEAVVGWGPGSADGTVNGSPVWVTPLAATRIYVDYQGDHLGVLMDANGNHYDTNYDLVALQSKKIYDPNKNQTGMRIYTLDGTLISAAWGEDPDVASPGNPYIDAGTTVLPFPVPMLKKTAVIINDVAPTNLSVGDTIAYTVHVDNKGLLPLGNTVVIDAPSTNLLYVTNSTTYNGSPIADSASGTAFPLDEAGYTIPVILSRGTSTFTYQCKVTASGTVSNSINIGGTGIYSETSLAPVPASGASVTVNFGDTNGVAVSLYSVGANVFVTMTNAVGNTTSNSAQSISVTVVNVTHGDLQTITLTETGTNSGVFRNLVGLPTSATAGLGQQDGTLNTTPGDILSVSYTDPTYGDSASNTAAIQIPSLTKQLYLSVNGSTNGVQALNRIDPIAYDHNPTRTSVDLGGASVVAVDSVTTVSNTALTATFSHTTSSGANRLMLVGVSINRLTGGTTFEMPTNVTYAGLPLVLVGGRTNMVTQEGVVWMFALINPPAGTANVVVRWDQAQTDGDVIGCATFTGVNQTTPYGPFYSSTNTSTAVSLVVPSAPGELVFDTVILRSANFGASGSPGANQTALWKTYFNARVAAGASTQPGATIVTNTWTVAAAADWAIGGISIKPASVGGSTNVTAFAQTQGFCSDFVMPSNNLVSITNYITVTNGVMPANPAVTASLNYNGTNILTLSNPTYSAAGSNLVWSGLLTSNVTIPAGQIISYVISNGQSGVSFHIDYDSTNKPSIIVLPASTVIAINTLGVYDAPYPGGSLVTAPVAGSTLYVRATVSDPFGSYDITSLALGITAPSPSANVNVVLNDTRVVANDGCAKTYEYVWTTGPTTGGYAMAATASEGTEGVTASAGASLALIFLDLGTPSATEFTSGDNGVSTNVYPASAAGSVCVRVTDFNRNTNAATLQSILATVSSSAGDSELITLAETGTNSGIFTACLTTSTNSGASTNDLTLYAPVGSILTVNYSDPTDPADNSSATATIKPLPGISGVAMNKTMVAPSGGQVGVGQPVTYNLQVVNTGSTVLTNVVVTDNFPSLKLSYSSAGKMPTTIAAGVLTWTNLGSLMPGQSTNFTVTFTTLATGSTTNSATANGGSATNSSSAIMRITHAALNVTKTLLSPTNTPVAIGSNVVFRILIQNVGDTVIPMLPFEDSYSAACYQFLSATIPPDGAGAGSLIWTNLAYPTALATNAIITNDITMKVVGQGSPANNSAVADYAVDIFGNPVPVAASTTGVVTTAASILGHVYNDINHSGVFTNGDTGLGGVSVQLFSDPNGDGDPSDGALVQIVTTDAGGYYELLNLTLGHYVAVERDLPGYASSAPANNRLAFNLTTLTATNGNNFFDYLPSPASYSTISGTVWNDANGNGTNDTAETGLGNVALDLVQDVNTNGVADAGEPAVASVTTDANGNYSFAGVTAGNYVVRATDLFGYYHNGDAQPPNDGQVAISASGGATFTNIWFLQHLNRSPVATNDLVSVTENVTTTIYPLVNDTDPDGNPLAIISVTTTNGTVTYASGTNVLFTPATNFTGSVTLSYSISDGHGGTASAFIFVTVANIPPVANPDNFAMTENTTNTFSPLINDLVQTPGGSLTIIGVSPTNGVATIAGTNVIFTPTLDFVGVATIGYVITDNVGGTNSSVITVNVTNVPPVAFGQSANLTENTARNLTLTGSDPISLPLTYIIVSGPASGTLSLVNTNTGAVTYTPNLNYTGADAFTFRVNNGYNNSPAATVNILVTNIPPIANPDSYTVLANSTNGFSPLLNDIVNTPGGILSLVSVSATNGTATISGTNVIFTPDTDYTGPATIGYTITDGIGGTSSSVISVTVFTVADVAVSKSGPATVFAASNLTYTVSVTNFGPSSASSVVVTDALPIGVTFVSATGGGNASGNMVSWNLGTLLSGQGSNVTVTVTAPASGTLTNVATVNSPTPDTNLLNNVTPPVVTSLTPVADLAIGKAGPAGVRFGTNFDYTISVTNFGPSSATGISVTDSLPAGLVFVSSVPVATTNANHQVIWTNLGSLVAGETTNLTLTVISPASGTVTNLASIGCPISDPNPTNNTGTPVVTAVTNTPPVANNQGVVTPEDTATNLVVTGTDVESTNLVYAILAGPANGTLGALNPATGSVTYTPVTNYFGPDSFTFTVFDGSLYATGMVSITVTPVNDAPVAFSQSVTNLEDTALPITLTGADVDGPVTNFVLVSLPLHGTLSGTGANLTYMPTNNYNGPDSFTFTVNDGSLTSAVATVSITILPVNDAPVAANDSASTPKNVAVTVPVLVNDSDPEGDPLTIISVSPTNGTANIVGTNVVFMPATNFLGTAFVGYAITDGNGGTNSALITISVTNRLPVTANDLADAPENVAVTIPVLVNDSDPDGDALTIISVNPTNGIASISGTNVVFAPATNFLGVATIGYVITDGFGGMNQALITVTVTNVPPLATPDSYSMAQNVTNTLSPLINDIAQTPGGNLTIISVTPTNGTAVIAGTNVIFTPTLNFVGVATIGYVITDNVGGTNSSVITVNVTNLPPVAFGQSVSLTENTARNLTLTGSDPISLPLTYIIVSGPANGTLTAINTNTGAVTYTPSLNYTGADVFTFRVNNGYNNSLAATVNILVTNLPPLANPDGYTVLENTTNVFSPLLNDVVNTPGGTLNLVSVSATNGTATISGTNIIFTPASNYSGPATIGYTITDGIGGTNNSIISVTVLAVADVAVSKSGPANVYAATNFNYTITVTNFGPGTAASLSVTDDLPAAVSFVSATAGATLVGSQLVWTNLGSLAAGAAVSLTVTVTAPVSGVNLTNLASGGSPTSDPTPTNNISSPVVTAVTPIANLAVGKTGPASVLAADNLTYTISVTNFGPSSASSVVVTDTLPLGVTFDSASANGTSSSGIVSWDLGTLASGQVSNLTVTVVAPVSGTLTNVASVSSPTQDTNIVDNVTPPVVTDVTPVADVRVSKAGPAGILFGTNFNYLISVTNFGPSTASSLSVTDNLPAGLVFVSALPATTTNGLGQVIWNSLGDLPAGTGMNLALTVISTARGTVTNIASGGSPTLDPTPTNNVTPPVVTVVTNYPPLANPDNDAMTENTTNTFSPLFNDLVNTPGGSLTIIGVSPTNGTATISGPNVTFTPTLNFIGVATIGYTITDNVGGTNSTVITVLVTNVPPVANPDVYSIAENSGTNILSPLVNDLVRTPGGSLTIISVSPTNGAASISGTNVLFVPDTNFLGVATIGYEIIDNVGGTNLGLITVAVTNRPPIAVDDFASTPKNVAVTISVLVNDADPDGNPLTVLGISPTNGLAIISGTNVVFTPTNNFLGTAQVGYSISDGNGGTGSAVITILVTNRPPVAVNDFTSSAENVAVTIPVLVNDTDADGDALTIVEVTPTNGLASISGTNLMFTPATNFIGTATVGYVITDSFGGSNFAVVTITVTNIPPVANPDSYSLAENTTNSLSPLINDLVLTPGGSLSIASVTPTNGIATIAGTNVIFVPTFNFIGVATIGYTITDNVGGTNSSVITVNVTNLPPTAFDQSVTMTENVAKVVALSGSDPTSLPLTYLIVSGPTNGTLTSVNTNSGLVTYTPALDYAGADAFTFRVNNGYSDSPLATVTLAVTPTADLVVVQTGPTNGVAGSNLVFTVTVTNLGPAAATNLVITNQLAAGFTFVGASAGGTYGNHVVIWPLPSLAAYAVTNLTVTAVAAEGGSLTNVASGTSALLDLNLTNNNGSLPQAETHTVISALADVAVFKDGGTNVYAGQSVAYLITATNAGPSTATNVIVQDTLPAGAVFQSASGSYSLSNGMVTWSGVTLAPNTVATFNLILLAPATVSSFLNIAMANSPTADPNLTNNNGSLSKSRVITQVVPSADVVVLLTGPAAAFQGSNFVYSLTVTNAGPSVSSNIVVSDLFPSNLIFVAASSGGVFSNNGITWPNILSLAVGATTNYTITARGLNGGVFTNLAAALAATFDPNLTNNSGVSPASQVQTLLGPVQFGWLKGSPVFNPQTGLYEEAVTVTNTGVATVAGFRLYVGGLRSGVTLYNATGTNNGLPFVQYNAAVDPGHSVGLLLEFYNPSRLAFTNTLSVEAILPPDSGPSGTNGSVLINRIFQDYRFTPARLVIEFNSVPGKSYTILYSTSVSSNLWKVATPTVPANANVTQWYDDGPPKTESRPDSVGSRYYRIIKN